MKRKKARKSIGWIIVKVRKGRIMWVERKQQQARNPSQYPGQVYWAHKPFTFCVHRLEPKGLYFKPSRGLFTPRKILWLFHCKISLALKSFTEKHLFNKKELWFIFLLNKAYILPIFFLFKCILNDKRP